MSSVSNRGSSRHVRGRGPGSPGEKKRRREKRKKSRWSMPSEMCSRFFYSRNATKGYRVITNRINAWPFFAPQHVTAHVVGSNYRKSTFRVRIVRRFVRKKGEKKIGVWWSVYICIIQQSFLNDVCNAYPLGAPAARTASTRCWTVFSTVWTRGTTSRNACRLLHYDWG